MPRVTLPESVLVRRTESGLCCFSTAHADEIIRAANAYRSDALAAREYRRALRLPQRSLLAEADIVEGDPQLGNMIMIGLARQENALMEAISSLEKRKSDAVQGLGTLSAYKLSGRVSST